MIEIWGSKGLNMETYIVLEARVESAEGCSRANVRTEIN